MARGSSTLIQDDPNPCARGGGSRTWLEPVLLGGGRATFLAHVGEGPLFITFDGKVQKYLDIYTPFGKTHQKRSISDIPSVEGPPVKYPEFHRSGIISRHREDFG